MSRGRVPAENSAGEIIKKRKDVTRTDGIVKSYYSYRENMLKWVETGDNYGMRVFCTATSDPI